MKKTDFDLSCVLNAESIKDSLEMTDEAYLVCFTKNNDYVISEIHDGEYYIGGDGFGYVNDSNIGFDSVNEVESYYKREYKDYIVFSEEYERDEFIDSNL